MADREVDLFVIGAGSGGVRAARIAAGYGARVMIAEEYRVGGRLTMIKVTPKTGRPYYLVADGTDGTWVRRHSLDTGLKVPMWLLFSF